MTAADVAAALPGIETLRSRCRAVAMLDAILSPEWEYRFYSYTANWGDGAAATEIRDGSGNDCFIVYTSDGVFIKGLDHESPMAPGRRGPSRLWPGLIDDLPEVFAEFTTEPAFGDYDGLFNATFCIWRQTDDSRWRTGEIDYSGLENRADPDGAHQMLGVLTDPTPQSYRKFASSYFGIALDPDVVAHIFNLRPLSQDIVRRINARVTLDDLSAEIVSSGYPTS